MAYTSYEILPARTINHRIVPRLWKLMRADGTFDLYCLSSLQHNCIQYLTTLNEAGVFAGRYNSDAIRSLGEYSINTNNSDFNNLSIRMQDNTRYGSIPNCSFRLKLNNSANIYPYIIRGQNYAGHNAGARMLRIYDGSSWITKAGGSYSQGNWGEADLWTMNLSDLSTVFDWKDYSEISVMFRAVDGTKFTGAYATLKISFVHRYTDGHPLHRYYR